MKSVSSLGLKFEKNQLLILDQTQLPHKEDWISCKNPDHMVELIQKLSVRGAPLIGVAAALSLAHFVESGAGPTEVITAAKKLRAARPTAVNLMAAIDRLILQDDKEVQREKIIHEAELIFEYDFKACEAIANRGAEFIQDGDAILTHCNTGGLVTAGIGTALGVVRRAHEQGKKIQVFVDETRPLLQGARLTTWELDKLKIPFTLICDNMAAFLMAQGRVQKVFVGADRIARNGDFANKIGTYGVAVLAYHHGVPFYVAAPRTTFDPKCANGEDIPIEERHPEEVRAGKSAANVNVWNPAFDVTPRNLISGIVFEDAMI